MPIVGSLLQNRYRIVAAIGQGGMGAVYQATDERLGHTVAVKQVLHSDLDAASGALRAAFEREARLLASLRHPALPKVTDHFVEEFAEESGQFLVMEYIPGDDLAAQLLRQREPFDTEETLHWADQVLDALIYLHSRTPPVIHRDIKPHNLKLNERGEAILLDFGLAKGAPGQSSGARSLAGYTRHYASPEQVLGEPSDARSDLYALGATLYDLLSTMKPPDALRRLAALGTGQTDPLRPLHAINPDVPAAVAEVIHRAMALAREERFENAEAMRRALHAAGNDTTEILAAGSRGQGQASAPSHNLPAQITSFVGRDDEASRVEQLLRADEVRLVTLTGPGGIGKTRLALAVANRCLAHFRDGAFFVSLAPIGDTSLVLPTMAQTLGLRDAPNTTVQQSLQTYLRDKEMLLVLDNFEHVVAAAPKIGELTAASPRLKVLVTSREALQIRGEQEFPVPTLGVPDAKRLPPAEELAGIPAVKLFVQRAQAVKPGFSLNEANAAAIAEICRRLDGLPLAIELAAAYIRVLTPQAILTRLAQRFDLLQGGLRDAPDRQRTLRASIGWSYDLLNASEKALFRQLCVFSGSFNLEAAEALCRCVGVGEGSALEGIASLVGKSLLKPVETAGDEPRFTLLETIREFGLKQLTEQGEHEAARAAHADYYYELAREASSRVWGQDIAEWVNKLEMEHDNLRAALSYYNAHEAGAERSLWLAGSLWRFWEIRGYISEGRAWLGRALARRAEAPLSSRWLALHGAGNLANDQGEYEVAKGHYLESLELLQTLLHTLQQSDPQDSANAEEIMRTRYALANTLLNLGISAFQQGDFEQAVAFTEESLSIHRTLNRKIGLAITINNLATIRLRQSYYDLAEQLSSESLAINRELGDDRGIGWNLQRLGTVARERGDYEQALHLYEQARLLSEKLSNQADMVSLLFDLGELARLQGDDEQAEAHYQTGLARAQELGNKKEIAGLLDRLGILARRRGDMAEARTLGERSIALQREIGNLFGLSEALHNRGQAASMGRRTAEAAADFAESLRLQARLGDRKGMVDSLKVIAVLAAEDGTAERAARLLSAAEKLRREIGIVVPLCERDADAERVRGVRARLEAEAFDAAWAEGEAMEWEQAVEFALSIVEEEK